MESTPKQSIREKRIRKITHLYYSRPDIQKSIFEFSKEREIVPRYFEGFGKRPDSIQYINDIFGLVKKGATSFHCSEELWKNPLNISVDMNGKQLEKLRKGWDLILDIDSKYLDYSKIMAELIIKILKFHGIKNFGIKFSGSKGFHIIVPWKAFPEEVNRIRTSDMFPEWPRIITKYLIEKTKPELIERISNLVKPNKYIKDFEAPKQVVPDLILVSSRHLFRMPYSLHEKTALASVVIEQKDLKDFQPKDADPLKAKVVGFLPESKENEAKELLRESLDWYKQNQGEIDKTFSETEFKPIKLSKLSDKNFPPSIKKILEGVADGRKRALFILLNLFRSVGMEKEEIEKRIQEWNKKNEVSLKEGYIRSQITWSYRNKVVPPPNFDKDYYKGIGVIPTEEEMRYKNPISYVVKKTLWDERNQKKKISKKQR